MSEPTFHTEDDYGILDDTLKLPYFAIKLTKEQVEIVKGKTAGIYEIDKSHQLFEVRLEDGTVSGEMMLYVVFV
jgi:hypothetical protein